MVQDRPTSELAYRAALRLCLDDGGTSDLPRTSRSDSACPLCARRARLALAGLARTPYEFLAATWVVLTVGDQLSSPS